jgi:tetratricopeptide (TPR) repeat protein
MTLDRQTLEGAVLLAAAALRGSNGLPPFPPEIERALGASLRALPPQWLAVGEVQASGQWLELAALSESAGLWKEAWNLLVAISDSLATSSDADESPAAASPALPNLTAFVSARRGRVARVAGWLDTAEACYEEALAHATLADPTGYWSDVYPVSWIGRCVVAVERGNYPLARRFGRRALRGPVPPALRAQAHQMLALIERKAGRPQRALRHLWDALDTTDAHAERRAEIMSSLAEVAFQMGQHCAALRAWLVVLDHSRTARRVMPSLVGIISVLRQAREGHDHCVDCERALRSTRWFQVRGRTVGGEVLQSVESLVHGVIGGAPMPELFSDHASAHDVVELKLAWSGVLAALDRGPEAVALASEAQADAERLGFHERTIEADAILASVQRHRQPSRHTRAHETTQRSSAAFARYFSPEFVSSFNEVSVG